MTVMKMSVKQTQPLTFLIEEGHEMREVTLLGKLGVPTLLVRVYILAFHFYVVKQTNYFA
jgi:hypothetical protein